ncbi:MAG: hypothetical protein DRI34_07255 [Deltaproteobacteria bacterium]|nr:MAG: hypothetical protein DRI34_07255 [Deltaproteobacteria bacterium]
MAAIRAITFDLWDTVYADDSDEPERARRGLPGKPQARRLLVQQALQLQDPVSLARLEGAYAACDAAFRKTWTELQVTWSVAERLQLVLAGLGAELPADTFSELVGAHERMELDLPPRLAPGVAEALQQLRERYRLGVISDTVFSPGWALRQMLERDGLADCFDAFVFSDEVGRAKPATEVFAAAARQLGVQAAELVHLGDREHNDVAGAHQFGARAVLVTVVKDRGSATTAADAVCADYARLPEILERLERQP